MSSSQSTQPSTVVLGLTLFAAPLLFGAARDWAQGLMEIGVLVAFLLSLRGRPARPAGGGLPLWGALCLMGLVAWAGVQLIPLPASWLKALGQPLWQLWQLDFLPAGVMRPQALLPISIHPQATASTGLLYLCYLLAFLLALRWGAGIKGVSAPGRLFLVIMVTGLAVAAVGIAQKGLDARSIYGLVKPEHGRMFTGPYANYNHFAGYLELALPLGVSLLALLLYNRKNSPAASSYLGLCAGAVAIMLAALFMSRSRGGILSFCLVILGQLVALAGLLGTGRKKARFLSLGLILLLLLGLGAMMTDWSRITPRFQSLFRNEAVTSLRWLLIRDVWGMSKQLPLTGSGLGTFTEAFAPFKTFARQGTFHHAHNEYLEFLAETGWPGLLMFLGFAAWVLARGGGTLRRALDKHRHQDPALTGRAMLTVGCLAGVISLLIHGMVDFNLRIPANALTWFVLCGLTVGLSVPPPDEQDV